MVSATKLIITGAAGRMGSRLVSLSQESPQLSLVGATESQGHLSIGRDVGEVAGCGAVGIFLTEDLAAVLPLGDVVIDFTAPVATLHHLEQAVHYGRAMVIGTTGFSPEELAKLRVLTQCIPCVCAPNMSVGINVLLEIVGKVAQTLGEDFDIEVIEAHHHKKKDAPSGTALKLAEALAAAMERDLQEVGVFARHGMTGERRPREIGMQTIRAGDIVGDHTILFGGLGERIEITHRAHNRDPFVRGALRAAEWVRSQPPGLYTMADVLGVG
ncbi:MAG: 4-hydroxy-tetrahydrodipicolinate reductase [Nitrospirales bacterium]|nr:4-hydroxy-tetrahydrodipicolinate reductase [Nitrospirales bacterium]